MDYINRKRRKARYLFLQKKDMKKTPGRVKHERKIGDPIKGFETSVPVSWIQKGYVVEN